MVFWIQTNVITIRITSLHGYQPSSVVFACKTITFESELQVSMCPRPHLSFCACKIAWVATELLFSMGPRPHLSFCACKPTWLASELLVSIGPTLICGFNMQNCFFWIRITSLYWRQTTPMFYFAFKTSTLAPELLVSMGPSPHLWFCVFTTATLWAE